MNFPTSTCLLWLNRYIYLKTIIYVITTNTPGVYAKRHCLRSGHNCLELLYGTSCLLQRSNDRLHRYIDPTGTNGHTSAKSGSWNHDVFIRKFDDATTIPYSNRYRDIKRNLCNRWPIRTTNNQCRDSKLVAESVSIHTLRVINRNFKSRDLFIPSF